MINETNLPPDHVANVLAISWDNVAACDRAIKGTDAQLSDLRAALAHLEGEHRTALAQPNRTGALPDVAEPDKVRALRDQITTLEAIRASASRARGGLVQRDATRGTQDTTLHNVA